MIQEKCKECQYASWFFSDRYKICVSCIYGHPPRNKCLGNFTGEQAASIKEEFFDDIRPGDYLIIDGTKCTVIDDDFDFGPEPEHTEGQKHVVKIPKKNRWSWR